MYNEFIAKRYSADPVNVPCPYCRRGVGAACKDTRGRAKWGRPHQSRKTAARKAA